MSAGLRFETTSERYGSRVYTTAKLVDFDSDWEIEL